MTKTAHDDALLGIYLNDHLAGAVAGLDVARRLATAERSEVYGPALSRMVTEIEEDRAALTDMMGALGIPVRTYKTLLGRAMAKLGSLKPNGRLVTRSPLSRVVELEALRLGVEGKAAGWRSLRARANSDTRLDVQRLDQLTKRADTQIEDLERLRVLAAIEAFGGKTEAAAKTG